jgi:hypothetical protein
MSAYTHTRTHTRTHTHTHTHTHTYTPRVDRVLCICEGPVCLLLEFLGLARLLLECGAVPRQLFDLLAGKVELSVSLAKESVRGERPILCLPQLFPQLLVALFCCSIKLPREILPLSLQLLREVCNLELQGPLLSCKTVPDLPQLRVACRAIDLGLLLPV